MVPLNYENYRWRILLMHFSFILFIAKITLETEVPVIPEKKDRLSKP